MKVNINGPGHITMMAAMAINIKKKKKHYKSSNNYFYSSEPKTHDFETWPEASMNSEYSSTKFV